MLPPAPKEKQIITGTPCSISSDHVVDETQNVKQPRGRRFEGPLWFNYGEGVSKMFWNMESVSFKFHLNLRKVTCFLLQVAVSQENQEQIQDVVSQS